MNPKIADWGVPTGLHIYNLDSISVALLLIIFVVGAPGGSVFWCAKKKARSMIGVQSCD